MSARPPRESRDDLEALLAALPPEIGERMRALPQVATIIEVVMDLGRRPEARFRGGGEEGARAESSRLETVIDLYRQLDGLQLDERLRSAIALIVSRTVAV